MLNDAVIWGNDVRIVIKQGVPAVVLALRKLLTMDEPSEPSSAQPVQTILDEGASIKRSASAVMGDACRPLPSPTGMEAAAQMKLGARVVRGPDWKWGDQVWKLDVYCSYA